MGSAAIAGAAFGLQALGQITAAVTAQRAARFDAQVAENNAELARRLAGDARERGRIEEQRQRLETSRLQGLQAAALAAGGVEVASGSPLQVLADSAGLGELDALQVRANAEREAYRYLLRGDDYDTQAQLSRARGRSALLQGAFRSGGSLLTGASGFAG